MNKILLTLLLFAASVGAVSTTCGLVNINYNDNLTILTNERAGFTVTVFNQGTTTQRISASAECDPLQLTCSFTGIGSDTLLGPSEQKTFSLNIDSTSAAGAFTIPAEFRAGPSSATCTAPLSFTANVVGQQTTSVQPLNVWITPIDGQNARPADVVEYTIGLKNNFGKKIFASLSSQGTNPFEASTTLSASNVALEAGETKYVTVRVTLPPGTPGGVYRWIYKVDAGNCCNYDIELPVEINVDAPHLAVQLLGSPVQSQCTLVSAGSTVSIPLSLQNNDEVTGPFDLSIQGTASVKSIVSVSEPRFTLQRGEEKPFQVLIAPTRRTAIDTYNYKLTGTYQGFVFLDRSFCFKVQGVESAAIDSPTNIVIERTRITNTAINLTNTGTVTDEYALSIDPTQEVTVVMQPSSFTLTPGQMQTVNLAITSDLTTPLGERTLVLRLDSRNYSKNINLNATVYATGRTGESLLRITSDREATFVKGIAKTLNVTVENVGTSTLRDVTLTLDGIDASWYESDSRTILPGGAEIYTILLNVPTTVSTTQFNTNVTARSGGEFLSEPLTLTASNVAFDFVVREIIENKNGNDETTSVDLIISLTNNGASPATQVSPLINDLAYVYTQMPASVTLQPGQSADVRVHLEPSRGSTVNQTIAIQFASNEGVSSTRPVTIPALSITKTDLTMKIAIILILLIGIVAVLAKTQNKI